MTDYYVRPVNGSDASAGTSFASAWKTFQFGIDSLSPGDRLLCCNEGTDDYTANINFDVLAGTVTSRIIIEGRDGTDGSTPDYFTVRATGSMASLLRWPSNAKGEYIVLERIIVNANGNATYGVHQNVDTVAQVVMRDCRVTGATSHGIFVRNNRWIIENTEVDNNGGDGITTEANRGVLVVTDCDIHDNTGSGINPFTGPTSPGGSVYLRNRIYSNGGDGIEVGTNYGSNSVIENNTIHGNSGDGIDVAGTVNLLLTIRNNALTSNGGYGMNLGATDSPTFNSAYNLCNGNISGATSGSTVHDHLLTSSPGYTDAANDDFTPTSSSALVGAGSGGTTIGALCAAAGGGGGGSGGSPIIGSAIVRAAA